MPETFTGRTVTCLRCGSDHQDLPGHNVLRDIAKDLGLKLITEKIGGCAICPKDSLARRLEIHHELIAA